MNTFDREKLKKTELIPLFDLAKNDIYDSNSNLKVPNIQRGLVWKSLQMELLWDSILRGFPIGSMLTLQNINGKKELLDGQQRANAIIAGFNKDDLLNPQKKPNTILWLDLAYKENNSDVERRKFGIRLTNSSHPWGFVSDGGKLSANERRLALKDAYGENYPNNKSEWDIRRFIPQYYKTQSEQFIPVPLAIFVNASQLIPDTANTDEFWVTVKEDIELFSSIALWKDDYKHKVIEYIEKLQQDVSFIEHFKQLKDYNIIFNNISIDDDIEILFKRVNRGGTQMTNNELAYAAIKHYGAKLCGCPDIGKIIKKASKGMMLEPVLAQIIFRYCFSNINIHPEIEAEHIRKQAFSNELNETTDKLSRYFADDGKYLNELLLKSKIILLNSPDEHPLPSFLIAEIATNNPSLFILLLHIIEKHEYLKTEFIQALVFYLYCFSNSLDPIRLIYNLISKECVDEKSIVNSIIDILRDSISREWCYPLISSFKNFPAFQENEFTNSWRIEKYAKEKGYDIFRLLFHYKTYQGLFMLKYAQRKFYNRVFNDYDPSSKEYWDEINRPWDHDHIIPQSWIHNGDWQNTQSSWVNSMGNIADIPFEQNRSKRDKDDFDYYDDNPYEDLYFDSALKNIKKQRFEQGYDMRDFMEITKKRFISISSEFLDLFKVLHINDDLSYMQKERKQFLLCMQKHLSDNYDLFYRGFGGEEILIANTIIEDTYPWQQPWVSLVKKGEDTYRKAIAIYNLRGKETSVFRIERGCRNMKMTNTSDLWWENGTLFGRTTLLFENEIISPQARIICCGAESYNDIMKLHGFQENSSSLLSYKTTIENIEIQGSIYDYYGCFYCSIRSINKQIALPKKVLEHFNKEIGFEYRHEKNIFIDKKISGKNPNIKIVCDEFAKLMKQLENLKN